MNTPEETWRTRLHAAVDDHPRALEFDVSSYLAAGRARTTRNRAAALVATVATVAAVAAVTAVATGGTPAGEPRPAPPVAPKIATLGAAANGWVAVDAYQDGGSIHLVRPGEGARRLEVPGPDPASEACPAWSPDGKRLVFGRVPGSSSSTAGGAELVVVQVGRDGATGSPTVIELDGFEVSGGFDPHPCATWAPDGRWVAFAGTGEVWVVDTLTGAIRRLPDLRPSDLEWRPGTDQLAIAGDLGATRGSPTQAAPVTVYEVSSGDLGRLGSVEAAHITWSPDGRTLAYAGGEADQQELRLVDADGTDERQLVGDLGSSLHGIGPVWSPAGDRIVYQRLLPRSGESHEVVLVDVADGAETVIAPPEAGGRAWYPFTVSWSPDGTTLLYAAWTLDGAPPTGGVIAVPADSPGDAVVLTDSIDPVPNYYSHRWAPIQLWGRRG